MRNGFQVRPNGFAGVDRLRARFIRSGMKLVVCCLLVLAGEVGWSQSSSRSPGLGPGNNLVPIAPPPISFGQGSLGPPAAAPNSFPPPNSFSPPPSFAPGASSGPLGQLGQPGAGFPGPQSFGGLGQGSSTRGSGFGAGGAFTPGSGLGNAVVTPLGPPAPVPSQGSFSRNGLFGGLFSRPASAPQLAPPVLNGPITGQPLNNPSVLGTPPPALGPSFGAGLGDVYAPQAQSGLFGNQGFGGGVQTGPLFDGSGLPSSGPTSLFPQGIGASGIFGPADGGGISAFRLLQGPRARHSFIGFGNDADDLNINDTDVSVIFSFPNFLYSSQPLYVVPSFSLHLWDGPAVENGADLPSNAYSAFIDFGWNSDPDQIFSTEFGVRIGAFTDFETFNSDSIRILGKGLGNIRLSPFSTFKFGVYYLDRNNIKILPAGGLLYQPNPFTRLDIFFPEPKLSRYLRTIGTQDVWWFAAGEFGGGSWTIERDDGTDDSIDINDIRVTLGLEWGQSNAIRAGRRVGFIEVGYVFERELEFQVNPEDNLDLDNGIIFRAGFGY